MQLNTISHLPKPLNHEMQMIQRLTALNVSISSLKMIQNNLNIHIYKWNKQLILPVSWLGVRCLYSTLNSDLQLSSVAKSLDLSPLLVLKVVTDTSALCWPHGIDLAALHIHRLWAQTARTSVTFALRFTQDASGFSLVDCFQKKKNSQWGVSSFVTAAAGRS